jgi:16S rRNA (cytidine1402-2'-O)-methyltransferase
LAPGLYVVGTPIGNLGDLTPRARATLAAVDAILAEDTRHTRKLLSHADLHTPLQSYHAFNEAARSEGVLARLRNGERLALVTDSGMPGVSDPGGRLVSACHAAEIPVRVVPGPSAVTAAVALSGLCDRGFLFHGFLPVKSAARRRVLAELLAQPYAVVLYESPHRIAKLWDELVDLAPERAVFAGRELTKRFEEARRGTAAELRAYYSTHSSKGEWALVIGAASEKSRDIP